MEDAPAREGLALSLGSGVVSGLAGTVVMTGFQRFVEMPLTGRNESYAPADMVQRVLPIKTRCKRDRRRLNYAAHFAVGAAWGAAHGLAARAGLRGQGAVAAVFGVLWPGDVVGMTALGLDEPLVGPGAGERRRRQARPGRGHGRDLRTPRRPPGRELIETVTSAPSDGHGARRTRPWPWRRSGLRARARAARRGSMTKR